jgi:hypothetical protein
MFDKVFRGTVVLPDRVIDDGHVLVADGLVQFVGSGRRRQARSMGARIPRSPWRDRRTGSQPQPEGSGGFHLVYAQRRIRRCYDNRRHAL